MSGAARGLEQTYTVDDVAAALQLHANRIYELVRRGEITACRVSRRALRFRARDVEQYLATHEVVPAQPVRVRRIK